MEFTKKAMLRKKKRNSGFATITFLGCVGVVALALAIYSLVIREFVFAIAYAVALVLSLIYTVMKINAVVPSYVACDEEQIYFAVWENDFFPYKIDRGFLGEFIPEKVKTVKIPMKEILSIFIGTGNFILRNSKGTKFAEAFGGYKKKFPSAVKRMEFFHITLKDGSEKYMPVTDFEPEELAGIVKNVQHMNPVLEFVTGNRKIRRYVPKQETKL